MNYEHKKKIDMHMEECVREINFDIVFQELVRGGIFNEHMQREILSRNLEDRKRYMLNYVKTRGPNAYKTLVYSLYNTNHKNLALLFDHRILRPESENVSGDDSFDGMQKAIERKDIADPSKVYHMGSKPRGLALIINVDKYVNNIHSPRKGSELDVQRLHSVLTKLSYKIQFVENPTSSIEFLEHIKQFSRSEEHEKYDSCIVVVMTHGKEGKSTNTVDLLASDGQSVNSEDIVKEFYGYNCKHLANKPKVFLFQACRGKEMDHAFTPPMNSRRKVQIDGKLRSALPRDAADILVAFPSAPGKVSLRYEEEGAWFIQELCNVICDHAWNCHLEDMIKLVDRNIKERYDDLYGKQTTCFVNIGFSKDLYFNPGLFDKP